MVSRHLNTDEEKGILSRNTFFHESSQAQSKIKLLFTENKPFSFNSFKFILVFLRNILLYVK